ncbi:hypothetical protein GCM10010831_01310 [Psychroflexus salis]|uniref:Oxygen tolerance n=2 Tax=Psychroflexus salis TaxID=1526574 RepID=A0A917E4G4_9FLAO|nr:hypothetical protein GCM10010831_01310 [Psychroflexus salis]
MLYFVLAFIFQIQLYGQTANASIDRDSILIGEQIKYRIEVDTKAEDSVIFPEGQTFVPLETVEAFPIDTLQIEPRLILIREYALTQFDSGQYTIPKQFIQLKNGQVFTDSIRVIVNNVVVDTTKQKLYPIKDYIEVDKAFKFPTWIWKLLLIILIIVVLAYIIYRFWQHKKEQKIKLPPYEQALKALENLDRSKFIEERNLREYYSMLTFISRKYLEDEVEVRAMEYTTQELIYDLQMRKDAGKIKLQQETIHHFKQILERADLAKFARSQPDVLTAKEDRKFIGSFTEEVNTAIPEPTEEELQKNKEYIEKIARKKQRIKWAAIAAIVLLVIASATTYLIASKGYDYVKDNVFGNPSKELLEGNWYTSSYGYPPVSITTPEILIRGDIEMAEDAKQMLVGNETFVFGGIFGEFYVVISTLEFQEKMKFDLDTAVDGIYENLEAKGAYNILTKKDEYKTLDGIKGVRVSGSFAIENPITKNDIKKEYQILNFGEMGGYQQITMIYNAEDTYAEEIVQRILNSIELKNNNN